MNHRISTLLIACMLMAQAFPTSLRAEFFKIEGISACLQKPKDGAGIYTDQYAVPLPPGTKPAGAVFQPSVVVSLTTRDPIAAANTYVHGYFYDERGQLTRTCTNPAVVNVMKGLKQSVPVFFHKEAPAKVFFQIPKELLNTDWKFVAVFGDKDEAAAAAYPRPNHPLLYLS